MSVPEIQGLLRIRLYISLTLLSAAIIAYQLVLMQILSITQWYHFAYMVISVALLGFGAAGSALAIFRGRLMEKYDQYLPALILLSGFSMSLVVVVSQSGLIRFDSYLVFAEGKHIGKLIITYLLFLLPFFFGSLAIGMIFTREVKQIGRIYFSNLAGSGFGGVLVLGLFVVFMPSTLPAVIGIITTIAGILILRRKQWLNYGLSVAAIAVAVLIIKAPPQLQLSEFKDISKTLNLPEASVEIRKNSPHGLLQTVSSPALRYGPGLSLTSKSAPHVESVAFINGDWLGPLVDFPAADIANALDQTTMALPYVTGQKNRILFLNAGTGVHLSQAIINHAVSVTLVEANGALVEILEQRLSNTEGISIENIQIYQREPRHFIARDTSTFDMIMIPLIGSFGGTNGMYATMEQFLLTIEGFRQMYSRLSKDGMISISCWMDYPLRNPLKVLSTISESLSTHNVDIREHVAAVRSWGTVTFIIKKLPLTTDEIEHIRTFCDSMQFDPLLLPGIRSNERARYNQLQDSAFFNYVDLLISDQRNILYESYPFRIKPATDNKPYFSQFLSWKGIKQLSKYFGDRFPFFEIGYLLVVLTLLQITVIAIVLIVLPLFSLRWHSNNKMWILLYFGGIGLGYMIVEISLIQRLTLYFGSPVYAVSAAISALLIFSGIGSYLSDRFKWYSKRISFILGLIILLLLIYIPALPAVLESTIASPLIIKILLMIVLVAPLAVCMGMPFPLGLLSLTGKEEANVPWAWGINSCLSVISAALATVVAIEFGFRIVMLCAAISYGLTLISVKIYHR